MTAEIFADRNPTIKRCSCTHKGAAWHRQTRLALGRARRLVHLRMTGLVHLTSTGLLGWCTCGSLEWRTCAMLNWRPSVGVCVAAHALVAALGAHEYRSCDTCCIHRTQEAAIATINPEGMHVAYATRAHLHEMGSAFPTCRWLKRELDKVC